METHSQLDDLFGDGQAPAVHEKDALDPAQTTSDEWAALFKAHDHDGGFAVGVEGISAALVDGADSVGLGSTATAELGDEDAWAAIFGME